MTVTIDLVTMIFIGGMLFLLGERIYFNFYRRGEIMTDEQLMLNYTFLQRKRK